MERAGHDPEQYGPDQRPKQADARNHAGHKAEKSHHYTGDRAH